MVFQRTCGSCGDSLEIQPQCMAVRSSCLTINIVIAIIAGFKTVLFKLESCSFKVKSREVSICKFVAKQ